MAVAYDAVGSARVANDTGGSFNHTCTGSNGYIILCAAISPTNTADTVTASPTYNSVSLAQLVAANQGTTNTRFEVWGLKAPATGTHSLAYTLTGSHSHVFNTISFTGVDQTTPIGTIPTPATGAGGNPSGFSVSGTATGMFMTAVAGIVSSAATLTVGTTGATGRYDGQQGTSANSSHLGIATVPGAASISDGWVWSVFSDWVQIGIPLIASTAVASHPPSGLSLLGVS